MNNDNAPTINTTDYGGRNEHRPLWELQTSELDAFQITPLSAYRDSVWQQPPSTAGAQKSGSRLNWDIKLFDGSFLTEHRNAQRLAWSKKLMALVLKAPAHGDTPAPGSLPKFQSGFKWLLSWMAKHGLQHPKELDWQFYLDDLPRYICEQNNDDEISGSQVTLALMILNRLWSERHLLNKWGEPSLQSNPFYEHGIHYHTRDLATKAQGWIPPLQDEVAIPIFNQAMWWLGEPAEDVIRLLRYVEHPEGEVISVTTKKGPRKMKIGSGKKARRQQIKRFFAQFQFTTLPGDVAPWHCRLDEHYVAANSMQPDQRVRLLYEAVREACALTIQGLCGMRISELIGIKAGLDECTDLPHGVRIEDSATGLYEVFIIHTVLSKTEKGLPREMDWVMGMRPKGSTDEPPPVRALRVLNRLQEPWRARGKTTRLFLQGTVGTRLPLTTTALGGMRSRIMLKCMKRFISRWVDLSSLPNESKHKIKDNDLVEWRESKGMIFKSHMLRKSWAQFMFAVDPRLMPAIQLQFHHLSMAMTDTGYIGDNPLLVRDMDSVRTQARNLMVLEMVLGHNPLAGRMGEQLEQTTQELAAQVKEMSTNDAYVKVIEFCEHAQLQIFFSPHGACMPVQTHEMRCQEEAGTPLLLRRQPNARTREPSLCAGCGCYVLDARHADFWTARYMDNWLAYKRAKQRGDDSGFKVIKERALQAGKLLKTLGVKVAKIDRKIEKALEADHVPT